MQIFETSTHAKIPTDNKNIGLTEKKIRQYLRIAYTRYLTIKNNNLTYIQRFNKI